jgi:hypothetical protein
VRAVGGGDCKLTPAMAGSMVNVLLNQGRGVLVVLRLGVERLTPGPKPHGEDESGQPAKKLWASANLIRNFDKHLYGGERINCKCIYTR